MRVKVSYNPAPKKNASVLRFIRAQDLDGSYERALAELRAGRKETCWIWWVFPMLKGIGKSYTSDFYGLKGTREAEKYLANKTLRERLRRAVEVVYGLGDVNLLDVFGLDIDVRKFHSCLTLFDAIEPGGLWWRALDKFFGGAYCEKTLEIISNQK